MRKHATVLSALVVLTLLVTPGTAPGHELVESSASFEGVALLAGAEVEPVPGAGPDRLDRIHVEAHEGSFRFGRGRRRGGELVNASAVSETCTVPGDGTFAITQEVWEAATLFADPSGPAVVFEGPHAGTLNADLWMHGTEHVFEGVVGPHGETCTWGMEDATRTRDIGTATLAIEASWTSEVQSEVRGKKIRVVSIDTTIEFVRIVFDGVAQRPVVSDDPDNPSPYAWSGESRFGPMEEVPLLSFVDDH